MMLASRDGCGRSALARAAPRRTGGARSLWLLLLVAACAHEPTAGEPQPFELLDQDAWSGGMLRVTSTAFARMATLPTVLIRDTAATVTRLDSITVAVQLPIATGQVSVSVQAPGVDPLPQYAQLAGFDAYLTGPDLVSYPEIWPPGSAIPSIIAIRDGRLVRIDLRSGSPVAILPDTNFEARCVPVPGLSGTPNVVAVAPAADDTTCGRVEAWSLWPTPLEVDSGPSLGSLSRYQIGTPVLYVGTGKWLVARQDSIRLEVRGADGSYTHTGFPYSGATRFAVSPRGDRALPLWGGGLAPTPVYDLPSGAVAYTVPPGVAYVSEGAAFSEAGDTLFVAIGTDVEALDATSGAVLGQVAIPAFGVADLAVDPGRPWLYVLADNNSPKVYAVDRRTLSLAGRLGPGNVGEAAGAEEWRLVLSPSERRLYVVLPFRNSPPTAYEAPLMRYTLLP
jgi:hypothetical protein